MDRHERTDGWASRSTKAKKHERTDAAVTHTKEDLHVLPVVVGSSKDVFGRCLNLWT